VLASYIEKADAIAIGPGLGRNDETDAFVRDLVRACGKPIVVDADGITAFAGRADELKQAGGPVVITPHSGELTRLTGEAVAASGPARLDYTVDVARRLGVTLVHKGAPTLIATPGGRVWINATGSSALATGGTGDVLTGMVGSFLAQASARGSGAGPGERAQPVDAACVGCFLHGRAGEIAARTRGVRGVIAGDLLESTGPALVALETAAGA
jgi:NAD(P)H-hydrate epimerase